VGKQQAKMGSAAFAAKPIYHRSVGYQCALRYLDGVL
jgi:hypothetical protein